MTIPTGEGHKCDLSAADEEGTPLPFRPARAAANDAKYGGLNIDTRPGDKADDAVVEMARKVYDSGPAEPLKIGQGT